MKNKYLSRNTLLYIPLFLYSVIVLYPFLWLVLSSLRKSYELFLKPWAFPTSIYLKNISEAWNSGIKDYFFNSLFVTTVSVIAIVIVSSMAAYMFARKEFRGKQFLFLLIVSGYLIPIQVTLIPLYSILKTAGLLDSYAALIGPSIAYGIPFSVLLLSTYLRSIPVELEEAAILDGCGESRIFLQIILPLSRPGIATIVVFQGVWIWNAYVYPLIFIKSKTYMTLPLGLMYFRGEFLANWPAIMAAITISTVPLVVLFIVFQNSFIKGITAGAVKA